MRFVGRTEQLVAVEAGLRSVDDGFASLVVVEGEAGIGKTALLDEAIRRWSARDAGAVRQAKADELAAASPFDVIATALAVGDRPSVSALVDHVASLVAVGPLALVVDDAQWLDPASSILLGRLLDELSDHRLVVALTVRPYPQPPALAALLARTARRTHVVLPPMTTPELVAVVASAHLDRGPSPEIGRPPLPLDQVGGNPLYALELAAAAAAEAGGAASLAPPLSVTILRRLGYLGSDVLAVLRVAALLGSSFRLDDLVLIVDGGASVALSATDAAVRAGVLRAEGQDLGFSHDLVRQALSDDMPEPVRRFQHRRIGQVLAEAGRPAVSVANHFERAAEPVDAVAAEWLGRAAEEVAARSSEAAIDLLRRAIARHPDRSTRALLAAQISVLLGQAGRYEEVLMLASAELASDPPADAAVGFTTSLAQALAGLGRAAEACRMLEERAVGATVAQRARLLGSLASMRLTNGEADAARAAAGEAVLAATEAGDEHWLRSSVAVLAWLAVGDGDADAAVELATRSLPSDIDETDPGQAVFGRIPLGVALLEADRLAEAAASFRRAIDVGERAGVAGNATLAHVGLALVDYASGRLDDAATGAETTLMLTRHGGNPSGDIYAHALLARIALHQGGVAAAEAPVAVARALLEERGAVLGAEAVVWAGACFDEAVGAAVDVDLAFLAWRLHPLRYLLTWRLVAPDLVRWLVDAGRLEEARSIVQDVEEVAGAISGRRAIVSRCRAALARTAPDAAAFDSPRPLETAAAHLEAARAHLADPSAGDRAAGIESLRAAFAQRTDVGAGADADAVLDLARRSKVRLGAARRDVGPSDALTPAERSVATLAAAGLTNRAIGARLNMSRHTVDTHLRHVYRKLGVTGRVELARRGS